MSLKTLRLINLKLQNGVKTFSAHEVQELIKTIQKLEEKKQ